MTGIAVPTRDSEGLIYRRPSLSISGRRGTAVLRQQGHRALSHGDNPVTLQTAEDAYVLIDAMLKEKFTKSVAALYDASRPKMEAAPNLPDHELRIAIAPGGKVGGIRYAGGDGWNTCYVPGQTSDRDEVFYNYMDNDEDWPRDSEVDIEHVRQAVRSSSRATAHAPRRSIGESGPKVSAD